MSGNSVNYFYSVTISTPRPEAASEGSRSSSCIQIEMRDLLSSEIDLHPVPKIRKENVPQSS